MSEKALKIHPFQETGLGLAPFKLVAVRDNLIQIAPGVYQPGGTCDHCATGIRYEFVVESADGVTSVVGSTCVNKTNDKALITDVNSKAAMYEHRQSEARKRAKRTAASEWRSKVWAAKQEARGDARGYDEALSCATSAARARAYAPISEVLEDGKHGFRDNMAMLLRDGNLPHSPRAFEIICEIMGKTCGRTGSKGYLEAYDATAATLKSGPGKVTEEARAAYVAEHGTREAVAEAEKAALAAVDAEHDEDAEKAFRKAREAELMGEYYAKLIAEREAEEA